VNHDQANAQRREQSELRRNLVSYVRVAQHVAAELYYEYVVPVRSDVAEGAF
jgi:hypothetical protein